MRGPTASADSKEAICNISSHPRAAVCPQSAKTTAREATALTNAPAKLQTAVSREPLVAQHPVFAAPHLLVAPNALGHVSSHCDHAFPSNKNHPSPTPIQGGGSPVPARQEHRRAKPTSHPSQIREAAATPSSHLYPRQYREAAVRTVKEADLRPSLGSVGTRGEARCRHTHLPCQVSREPSESFVCFHNHRSDKQLTHHQYLSSPFLRLSASPIR